MPAFEPPPRPWVIGHRGTSGLRPEHTLAAYALAIEQGADLVEPDLVVTRDGHLVARHENEISGTTDVAKHREFGGRFVTKQVEGRTLSGWFTEDFTLEELQRLRARERIPQLRPASAAHDGRHKLVTFDEIVNLVREQSAALGRSIGIVAEVKHAAYFASIGLPFDNVLAGRIERHGFGRADPIFIESFEPTLLQRLRGRTPVRLVQAIASCGSPADRPDLSFQKMVTPAGLQAIASYADAIAPDKSLIRPCDAEGVSRTPTRLVADAHAAGLLVFPWTFRSENFFLPAELRCGDNLATEGKAAAEYRAFYDLGVDAVFSDFPAAAVQARA